MARLNDTGALVGLPMGESTSRTRSVRKIDNGYIVNDCEYSSDTGYSRSSERFSSSPPKGFAGNAPRSGVGNESLSDTKKYLGEDI